MNTQQVIDNLTTTDPALAAKLTRMRDRLAELGTVAVAFSAGVDSTFVLKVAVDALGRENVLAVTARSPSVPRRDLAEAERLATLVNAEHLFIDTNEFANADYTANPTNRCYFCKSTLYTHMDGLLAERGIAHVINGTNADDLGDWRPGLLAAGEHTVVAPAADCGMTKADIRKLSSMLGLPTHDKPASPCLSSRVPYGQEVTPQKLRMIEIAENFLREHYGFRDCRVRHYGDFARIEVPPDDVPTLQAKEATEELAARFRAFGFPRVEIDPQGFRSGALNEVIAFGQRQGSEDETD